MLKQSQPIANVFEIPTRMTYAEFLRREDGQHTEWVDGEVVAMAPISIEHNDLTVFLLQILGPWAQSHDLGTLKCEPYQMKTGPDLPGRSPDIMFIAKRNLSRLKKTHLEGPADLVIEIISPGSQSVDRGEKYYEYEKGGVREYWLIDPIRRRAEFYVLCKDGSYRLASIEEGIYRSAVMKGLWLKVAWLWQKPLPSVLDILKVWKLAR